MNKGFTVAEMMLSLLVLFLVVDLGQAMLFTQMKRIRPLDDTNHQVFQVQIRRLLHSAQHLEKCRYTKNMKEFELVLHQGRLVQRPGFHILLDGVSELVCFDKKIEYNFQGNPFASQ